MRKGRRLGEQPVVARGTERRFERRAAELLRHQERDGALEHRRLDAAALAGLRAVGEGGGNRDREVQATDLVAEYRLEVARFAVFVRIECRNPCRSLDDVIVGRLVRIGSALVKAGGKRIDEPGIDRGEARVIDAELRRRAWTHVVHDGVGVAHQPVEHLAGLGAA